MLEIWRSRVQVQLWPPAGFVLARPWFNSSAAHVHSQLICLLPVGILQKYPILKKRNDCEQWLRYNGLISAYRLQKNPPKNAKCSTNETILKIGHQAKPCKNLTLRQKFKFQKTCQNPFYKLFGVVLCKKPLNKTLNIREMRPFWKSAIMQRL